MFKINAQEQKNNPKMLINKNFFSTNEKKMLIDLTENEAYIIICFFCFKNEFNSQNELSRSWADLTNLSPNTYYQNQKRLLHDFNWIIEIKDTRSYRLILNEELLDDIYNSKVKINQDFSLSFFTFTFIKTFTLIPNLTTKEKQIFIQEIFDHCSEIDIEPTIKTLEEHNKKNISSALFLVNYTHIIAKFNELEETFNSLEEFNDEELVKCIEVIKNNKIEVAIVSFLKNRIEKAVEINNIRPYQKNLLYLKIHDLIRTFQNTNANDELRALTDVLREFFNDGIKILYNLGKREKFLTYLEKTIDQLLKM